MLTHAPRFFVAMPHDEKYAYLHRTGCRLTRVRNRTTLDDVYALRKLLKTSETLKEGRWWVDYRTSCPCLLDAEHALHEARADAWLAILADDSESLPGLLADRERHAQREAKRAAWLAQFQPLLDGVRALWGWGGADFRISYRDFELMLSEEGGWSKVTIALNVEDGARSVTIGEMNSGSWIGSEPERIHRLSRVLHFIEMWRAAEPLTMPAEAPQFYAA